MLALTHHLIIQWAAARAERNNPLRRGLIRTAWFQRYAVLGDDVVIADGRVAREYLILMDQLGVGIGLAKSLRARKPVFEFAKRFYTPIDCSPISFLELAVARSGILAMVQFSQKWGLSRASVLALLDYGYKVRGKIMSRFDRMTGRLSSVLWAVERPRHSFEDWLRLDTLRPSFRPDVSSDLQTYKWWEAVKVLFAYYDQVLHARVMAADRSLSRMAD